MARGRCCLRPLARDGALLGAVDAPKVWSPRAVAAARGQEARAGGNWRGPPAGAVVGRGSNFSSFGPPPRVKNESFTLQIRRAKRPRRFFELSRAQLV